MPRRTPLWRSRQNFSRESIGTRGSSFGLLRHQPAPQISVGCFFAVQLDVKAGVLQILQLLWVEVDSAGNRSACALGRLQIEDGRTADPSLTLVNLHDGGGRF